MRIEDYTLNFRDQSVVEAISGAELIDKLLRQCSGLLIPDTDLGENPRRERGV